MGWLYIIIGGVVSYLIGHEGEGIEPILFIVICAVALMSGALRGWM